MKIGEKVHYDNANDKLIVEKKFTNTPYLDLAKTYRDAGVGMDGESRLAGIIPTHIMSEWFKEAGVSWDDVSACQEIVKKKILSGDFDKLRVWKGTY